MSDNYKEIRDKSNHRIASILTNGNTVDIRDNAGHKKGSYNTQTDRTTDNAGNFIGRGNQLLRLLD